MLVKYVYIETNYDSMCICLYSFCLALRLCVGKMQCVTQCVLYKIKYKILSACVTVQQKAMGKINTRTYTEHRLKMQARIWQKKMNLFGKQTAVALYFLLQQYEKFLYQLKGFVDYTAEPGREEKACAQQRLLFHSTVRIC